jgi:hypothetical protein
MEIETTLALYYATRMLKVTPGLCIALPISLSCLTGSVAHAIIARTIGAAARRSRTRNDGAGGR